MSRLQTPKHCLSSKNRQIKQSTNLNKLRSYNFFMPDSINNEYYRVPTVVDRSPDYQERINDSKNNVNEVYIKIGDKVIAPFHFQPRIEKAEDSTAEKLKKLDYIANAIDEARKVKVASQFTCRSTDKPVAKKFVLKLRHPKVFSENDLMVQESEIGAKIFGPIMSGERREFFYDNNDWFFHQEITDANGNNSSRTLHYEILPTGVLLVGHDFIQGEELNKFVLATELYHERVMGQIYPTRTRSNSVDARRTDMNIQRAA